MSAATLPEDTAPLTPAGYVTETLQTWQEFSRRTGKLWLEQVARMTSGETRDVEVAETITAETLRTLSDFNLRHWQNTARFLDMMPSWMTTPSFVSGSALTDWFDRLQRAQREALDSAEFDAAPIGAATLTVTTTDPASSPDDLTVIRGIGPKLSEKLNALGIFQLRQIASLSDTDIAEIDSSLGNTNRVRRDDWIGQARKLTANGAAHA